MDKLEKVKKIEYLKDHSACTDLQRNALGKMFQRTLREMFDELCEEYNICNICGKDLKMNQKLMIDHYPSTFVYRNICPDSECKYNKILIRRLREQPF